MQSDIYNLDSPTFLPLLPSTTSTTTTTTFNSFNLEFDNLNSTTTNQVIPTSPGYSNLFNSGINNLQKSSKNRNNSSIGTAAGSNKSTSLKRTESILKTKLGFLSNSNSSKSINSSLNTTSTTPVNSSFNRSEFTSSSAPTSITTTEAEDESEIDESDFEVKSKLFSGKKAARILGIDYLPSNSISGSSTSSSNWIQILPPQTQTQNRSIGGLEGNFDFEKAELEQSELEHISYGYGKNYGLKKTKPIKRHGGSGGGSISRGIRAVILPPRTTSLSTSNIIYTTPYHQVIPPLTPISPNTSHSNADSSNIIQNSTTSFFDSQNHPPFQDPASVSPLSPITNYNSRIKDTALPKAIDLGIIFNSKIQEEENFLPTSKFSSSSSNSSPVKLKSIPRAREPLSHFSTTTINSSPSNSSHYITPKGSSSNSNSTHNSKKSSPTQWSIHQDSIPFPKFSQQQLYSKFSTSTNETMNQKSKFSTPTTISIESNPIIPISKFSISSNGSSIPPSTTISHPYTSNLNRNNNQNQLQIPQIQRINSTKTTTSTNSSDSFNTKRLKRNEALEVLEGKSKLDLTSDVRKRFDKRSMKMSREEKDEEVEVLKEQKKVGKEENSFLDYSDNSDSESDLDVEPPESNQEVIQQVEAGEGEESDFPTTPFSFSSNSTNSTTRNSTSSETNPEDDLNELLFSPINHQFSFRLQTDSSALNLEVGEGGEKHPFALAVSSSGGGGGGGENGGRKNKVGQFPLPPRSL